MGFTVGILFAVGILLRRRVHGGGFLTRRDHFRLGIALLATGVPSIASFVRGGGSNAGFFTYS